MQPFELGGSFESFNDPSGSPLIKLNRNGSIYCQSLITANGTVDISQFGGKGDGVTDNTNALKAAIAAVQATGGGTITFPAGVFLFNGPQVACGSGGTGIVNVPTINQPTSLNVPFVTIALVGASTPTLNFSGGLAQGGTVLQTTQSGSTYNFICGGALSAGGFTGFTNVSLVLKNLTFRSYANPNITMVNATHIAQSSIEHCLFDTGTTIPTVVPTNANGIAYSNATTGNSDENLLFDVYAYGYYTCYNLGEHTEAYNVHGGYAVNGLVVATAVGAQGHPVRGTFNFEQVQNNIAAGAYGGVLDIQLDTEHDSGTFATIYDVNDSGNLLSGNIRFFCNIPASAGSVWTKNGGVGVRINQIQGTPFGGIAWTSTGLISAPSYTDANLVLDLSGQVLTITAPGNYTVSNNANGYVSSQAFSGGNFTGHSVAVRVGNTFSSSQSGGSLLTIGTSSSNWLCIFLYEGTLYFQKNVANAGATTIGSVVYAPNTHTFWRLRESAGTIFAETSPDGLNYSGTFNTSSIATPFTITSGMQVSVGLQLLANTGPYPGYVAFDRFTVV